MAMNDAEAGFYAWNGVVFLLAPNGHTYKVNCPSGDIEPRVCGELPKGATRLDGLNPEWIVHHVSRVNLAYPKANVSEADMLAACGHPARNPAPEEKPADPTLSDLLAAYHLVLAEEEEAKEELDRLQATRTDRFLELGRAVREMMKSPTGHYRTDVAVVGDYALYLDRGELVIRKATPLG